MEKKKVCFFIGSLKIGGAQKHLVDLINNLDRDVVDIYLALAKKEGDLVAKLNLPDTRILDLKIDRYYDLTGLKALFRFAGWLRRNEITILHAYLFECNIFGALCKMLIPKLKYIMSIRNMNYTHTPKKYIMTRLASMFASKVSVVSTKVGEYVVERERISPGKLITLYNAVDHIAYAPPRRPTENSCSKNGLKITCVASLNMRKGHEHLLDAFSEICKEHDSVLLYLLGDGKNRVNLERQVKALGLQDRVVFCGYETAVMGYLDETDIFVLPSFEEGMSNALLEAMSKAIPCVATDVGGNSEVNLDGLTGFIVPPGDSGALAGALRTLIADDGLRKRFGTAARERVLDAFTIDRMVGEYQQVYLTL